MGLTEDEIMKKYGTLCKHCGRIILLPYDYEWSCFGCRYKVLKKKH